MKKVRPLGNVLLELETVLEEMVDSHDLQAGDILNLVFGWIQVHRPAAIEEYVDDDSSPVFYYGPRKEKNEKL